MTETLPVPHEITPEEKTALGQIRDGLAHLASKCQLAIPMDYTDLNKRRGAQVTNNLDACRSVISPEMIQEFENITTLIIETPCFDEISGNSAFARIKSVIGMLDEKTGLKAAIEKINAERRSATTSNSVTNCLQA